MQSGRYEAIYVRTLTHALQPGQVAAVQRFATEASSPTPRQRRQPRPPPHGSKRGGVAPCSSEDEVTVLMAVPPEGVLAATCAAPVVERFITSRLVADMLRAAHLVRETNGHTFTSCTLDDRLLQGMRVLASPHSRRGRAPGLRHSVPQELSSRELARRSASAKYVGGADAARAHVKQRGGAGRGARFICLAP